MREGGFGFNVMRTMWKRLLSCRLAVSWQSLGQLRGKQDIVLEAKSTFELLGSRQNLHHTLENNEQDVSHNNLWRHVALSAASSRQQNTGSADSAGVQRIS